MRLRDKKTGKITIASNVSEGGQMSFAEQYGNLTVGKARKLNKRERRKMRKIDWDKVLICGVSLGFMASVIYMLFVIALEISK